MEINQLKLTSGIYQKGVSGKTVKAGKADSSAKLSTLPSTKAENSDKLELSSAASQQYEVYRVTKNVMSQMEEEDTSSKVNELQAKVQGGTYHVSMDALVDKLISRLTTEGIVHK